MDNDIANIKEWRRLRALHLSQLGWRQREIAVAMDVTEAAVSRWLAKARSEGEEGLRSQARSGRPSKLTAAEKRLLPDCLWHGAEAYGFQGEFWTCARVAGMLAEEFGVSYSKSQVSRLLKALGWTPQIPITRAIQRDEEAIAQWRAEVWPELKKRAKRERKALIFMDESGFYLLPGIVKTYAPKGQTPVLHEWQTRDHLSVMGAVTLQGRIYTLVRQESLNGLHTVAFLQHLMRMVGGRLLVILDRSPIHRRAAVKEFVAEIGENKIHLEELPSYAPDLNPTEWMWNHLKHVEMRNLVCLDLEQLHMELHLAIGRLRQKPHLLKSFFKGAGLNL
jgi:transposase